MAIPTCPKCEYTHFELKDLPHKDAKFRIYAVICSSCGCIVSTEPVINTAAAIDNLAAKLGR